MDDWDKLDQKYSGGAIPKSEGDPWDELDRKISAPAPARPIASPDAVAAPPEEQQSAAYMAGRKWNNSNARQVGQSLTSVLQGPTLGFGDEIIGAVGGAYDSLTKPGKSLRQNYEENRDVIRGINDRESDARPILSGVTKAMASAPLMAVGKVVGAGRAALPQIFRASRITAPATGVTGALKGAAVAAGAGAAFGGADGAGNATKATGGTLAGAARGAATGAALGAVLRPVTAGVGAVAGNVMQRVSTSSAAQAAREKLAQAFARDQTGIENPIARAAARIRTLGPQATVADSGGKSTIQLLDTLATLPGETRNRAANLLRQRTATVGERMRDSAESAFNTQGQRLPSTVQSLVTRRQNDASPLYNELRNVNISPSDGLFEIVKAADDLGATKLGKEIAKARQLGYSLDLENRTSWNMGDLDHVKQGIDQVLSSSKAMKADGTMTPLGNAYMTLKNRLLSEMDSATLNPNTNQSLYRNARSAFEDPSKLIDAANAGKSAITRDEATIKGMTNGMSANELQAFRIGAFEGLRGKLGTQGGQTNIMNMWKEPSTQEKLRAVFGNERDYRKFAADTARESRLKQLQSVGTGSQTASRLAAMDDLEAGAIGEIGAAAANAKTGNILGVVGNITSAAKRLALPENTRNEMGKIMLTRGAEGQQNITDLLKVLEDMNRRRTLQNTGYGAASGLLAPE